MERYLFLFFTLAFLLAALFIYVIRPDLRRFMLRIGVLGGIAGLICEYWYFQDYWRPPTLFGTATLSIEDFLFGFAIVSLGATAGLAALGKKHAPRVKGAGKKLLLVVLFAVVTNIVMVNILGINSIIATYVIFGTIAALGLILHPQLWKMALISAGVLMAIAFVSYFIVFGLIDPSYVGKYFLLTNNSFLPTLGGFMPITELIWYALWGIASTVILNLVNGRRNTFQATA